MKIYDPVYGEEEITEPILLDLICSKEFQRLKGVSQHGMPAEYYFKKGFTRYDHSLGVLILLRRLGAKEDEQIAGLLHDINHPAFSHVIDWIFGDPLKENHQDESFSDFLKKSEIPSILKQYKFDLNKLENIKKYTLLERDAPSLCADRIDYTLRELFVDGYEEEAKLMFDNLFNLNGQIVFKTESCAKLFFEKYFLLNKFSWSGEDSRARYVVLSSVLKKSFDLGFLFKEDLYKSEEEILNILWGSKEKYIIENLNLLKQGFVFVEDIDGFELKTKFRYIDPEIFIVGDYKKLSDLSSECKNLILLEKGKSNNFKKIRVFSNTWEFNPEAKE